MITVNHGLSRCVLYYWYNHIDEPSYYTKDGILNLKRKFDKGYKWHFIKLWGFIFLFSLSVIGYILFCFYAYNHFPKDDYINICTIARLPFIIVIPFAVVFIPYMDEKLLNRRKSFYDTFGHYFNEYDQYKKETENNRSMTHGKSKCKRT
jgi:uncharacterized membrane protein